MLTDTKALGPVRVPWEFVAGLTAVVLTLVGLFLLATGSWFATATGVALVAVGMLLFQLVLHECAHGTFFRSRWLNEWTGFLIGLWVLTPFFSFRRGHTAHHACLGSNEDPTAAPRDSARRHWLIELFVRLRIVPILYLGGVYGPYLLYDVVRGKDQKRQHLLQYSMNILAIVLLHALMTLQFGLQAYLLFLITAFWLSGILYEILFTQNQHVGLLPVPEASARYANREQANFSRSVRLPLAGLFMYFNLHKEHHLFPQLPCRYLPRIHEWLKKNRSDVLDFTSDHLGILERRKNLKLFSPTIGDHDS